MRTRMLLGGMLAGLGILAYGLPQPGDASDDPAWDLAELIAPMVERPPLLDGRANDPAWFGAGRLTVPTVGGPAVSLRALVAGNSLYMLAQWDDPTESMAKKTWHYDGLGWQKGDQDEDRFSVLWPIGPAAAELVASQGCAFTCHTEDPDVSTHDMWMTEPGHMADLWHWKSVRSNPVGFADDQHLVYRASSGEGGGRVSDPGGNSSYQSNTREDKKGPAFGFGPDSSGGSILTLLEENAVPVESTVLTAGTVVPAYVLRRAAGNRGDIRAAGVWENDRWTLELKRKLDTTHPEDVAFVLGESLPFGIAVMDNGGGDAHKTSGPVALRITEPLARPSLTRIYALLLAIGALGIAGAMGSRK